MMPEENKNSLLKRIVAWVGEDLYRDEADNITPTPQPSKRQIADTPKPQEQIVDIPDIPVEDEVVEDFDDDAFEYPDEVSHDDLDEPPDEDYVAGDETLSAVQHEAVHLTKEQKVRMKYFRWFYMILSAVVALNLIIILLLTVNYLPEFGSPDRPSLNEVYIRYADQGMEDTGSLNMVAAVLFSYRSFDTLGEAFVLFTAVIAVMILMLKPKKEDENV